jgi:uncharacterized spore protein YtfJ
VNQESSGIFMTAVKGHEQAMELMKKLTDVAQPSAVFSEPIAAGDRIVITASEVSVGLGFGYGMGGGTGPQPAEGEEAPAEGEKQESQAEGVGGGGGGGGGSMARPIAVIQIGPDGVQVEPIVDVTKIVLAFFTMLGSLFMIRTRMRRYHMKHMQ